MASRKCRDFLTQTLLFDYRKRPSARTLLAHPYLAEFSDPAKELSCRRPMEKEAFFFDTNEASIPNLKWQMWHEMATFVPRI